jgi:hypothetical protein
MKALCGVYIAASFAFLAVLFFPLRQGSRWAVWYLPLFGILVSVGHAKRDEIFVIADPREVPIFDAARTVVDCFKFRNKIGLDVALKALRDGWSERRFTMDELGHQATRQSMANVMRPYIEAIRHEGPSARRCISSNW